MTDREFLNEMWPGWSDAAAFEFLPGFTLVVVRWMYRGTRAHWETTTKFDGVNNVVVSWSDQPAKRFYSGNNFSVWSHSDRPATWTQANVEQLIDRHYGLGEFARSSW